MKNISFNYKALIYIVIVYPFFKPFFFAQLGEMSNINDMLFILSFIIIGFMYLLNITKIKFNKGFLIVITYYVSIFISTLLNESLEFEFILNVSLTLGLMLFINYTILSKNSFMNLALAFNILTYLYVVLNLISMYIYPNGIPSITYRSEFPYYIFGNTNNVIKFTLPGLCFTFLYDSIKYKNIRKRTWLLLILVWLTLIKSWSVTAMIGLFIFTIIVINKLGKKQIFYTYLSFLIGSICLTIFLLFFRTNSDLLRLILEQFGKDLTLTNRDILWENAINSIKHSLIWGYGHQNSDVLKYYIGNSHGSHNYFLDTAFRGGFVALFILLFSLFSFGKSLLKIKGNIVTRTLIGTSSAYFIMWVSEPFIATEYLMFSIILVIIPELNTLLRFYYDKTNRNNKYLRKINSAGRIG